MATDSPDSVLQMFFGYLQDGKPDAARELFLIRNPEQERAVGEYVAGGISFFARQPVTNRVVEAFADGRHAVCAIEQTSANRPGMMELESGCLMLESGQWRLLPTPQDHRAGLNGLSRQEVAVFDILQNKFSAFKRDYGKMPDSGTK